MSLVTLTDMTREEIRTFLKTTQVTVIPVGSTEQHGAHLPLSYDSISASWMAEKVAQRLYPKVLVAPTITLGLAKHHMRFPGTITLEPKTFVETIIQVGSSLKHHGISKAVILNGHGGNYNAYIWGGTEGPPVVEAAEKLRQLGIKTTTVNYWNVVDPQLASKTLEIYKFPGHSAEFETSAALYICPEKVRVNLIQDVPGISQGATKATAEKGQILMEAAIDGVVWFMEQFLDDKIDLVFYNPHGIDKNLTKE